MGRYFYGSRAGGRDIAGVPGGHVFADKAHGKQAGIALFDYVIGITVGSIAAEMATELDTPENSLVAMVVYAVAAVCISLWTNKSLGARRIITGKPLILMDGGVIYRENLKKAKMDLGDFLMYCRIGGYFDLGQIQTALLEHNGTVTFLPVEMQRPATPADLSMQPDQTLLQTSVIQDGVILLQRIGKDESWLVRQLEKQGYKEAGEVFLAMADGNQVTVFPMESKRDLADR